jgi:hypothetical protein
MTKNALIVIINQQTNNIIEELINPLPAVAMGKANIAPPIDVPTTINTPPATFVSTRHFLQLNI